MCLASFASSYSAPLMDSNAQLYKDDFSVAASGGTGTYTYEWFWPGSGHYVSGGENEQYEFTSIGSSDVNVQVASKGYSTITLAMPVDVELGSPPGHPGFSVGWAGSALSLSEVETHWVEKALGAGVVITAVVAAVCALSVGGAPCAAIAGLMAALFAGFLTWAEDVDNGKGVFFAFLIGGVPYAGANPVPSELSDL